MSRFLDPKPEFIIKVATSALKIAETVRSTLPIKGGRHYSVSTCLLGIAELATDIELLERLLNPEFLAWENTNRQSIGTLRGWPVRTLNRLFSLREQCDKLISFYDFQNICEGKSFSIGIENANLIPEIDSQTLVFIEQSASDLLEIVKSVDLDCITESSYIKKPVDEHPNSIDKRPKWNKDSRTLSFDNREVRKYIHNAKNVIMVLNVFEEEGWPKQIDDPLPHADTCHKKKLRDTVYSLNKSQGLIRFSADNAGEAVCWNFTSEK